MKCRLDGLARPIHEVNNIAEASSSRDGTKAALFKSFRNI